MMARSHVVVGLAAWVAAAPILHIQPMDPLYLGLAVAGSLLPDIDHPKSWVGQRTRPLSTAIAKVFSHRGITHSAFAVIVLALLMAHAGYHRATTAALVVGYISHLAADLLTPRGLRLAWPFGGNWGIPICRTNSRAEPVIVTLVASGVTCWYLRHHPELWPA
jgi:inner membrane protein